MNAKRILGNANQPVPHEPEKDEAKVDPEKFKKVMKIDESDQAQKRNKRNLKREEEEGDEEGAIEEPAPPSASSSFSEFMDDSDVLGNVFESDAAGIRRQAAPQNKRPFDLPSPGSIDTRGVELSNEETSLNTNAPQPQRSDNLSSTNEVEPQHPNPSNNEQRSYNLDTPPSYQNQQPQYQPARPPSQNTPYRNDYKSNEENTDNKTNENTDNKTEEKSADNSDSKPKKKKKTKKHVKKEEVDSSLLTNQTKRGALKKKKKKIKPTPKIKTVSSDLKSESKDDNENIAEKSDSVAALDKNVDSSLVPPKKQSAFKKLTSSEVREKQKKGSKKTLKGISTESKGKKKESGDEKNKEDEFPEATIFNASVPLPVSSEMVSPINKVSETISTYSKLKPEVFELFEKMGGVISIQKLQGITRTSMVVNMPNSVFNGAEIVLDQYSSAPQSYNIQLKGSPEAARALESNLSQLEQAFKDGHFDFEVNLLKPEIANTPQSPHMNRRREDQGGQGGQGGQQNQDDQNEKEEQDS